MTRVRLSLILVQTKVAIWILTLLLSSCLATHPAPGYVPLSEVPVMIDAPLRWPLLEGQVPIVRVRFPGLSPAGDVGIRMVVDSGAETSLLSRSAAELVGLRIGRYRGSSSIEGSAGGFREVTQYATIDSMHVEDLQIDRFYLSLVEPEAFAAFDFDGIIGQDLLLQQATVFDMERREITFLPTGISDDGITEYIRDRSDLNGTWRGEPIDFRPRPFVEFHVVHEGRRIPVQLLIDTGATNTSMPTAVCELLGPPIRLRTKIGLDGRYQAKTYALHNFPLCGFTIGGEVVESRQEYGLLGMDILGGFVLILNGPSKVFLVHHRRIPPDRNQ